MVGIGGAAAVGVGLRLTFLDAFTPGARRAGAALATLDAQSRRVANNMKATGMAMMVGAAVPALMFGKAISMASKFEYTMSGVKASAEGTKEQFQELDKLVMKLGKDSIFSSQQVGESAYNMAKAGYEAKDIINSLPGIVNLAAAGDIDLAYAGDFVAKIRNAFQIPTNQTDRIGDVITKGALMASGDVKDIAAGLRYSVQRATTLGMTLEETVGSIVTLSNMGMQGSTGGVALDNFMRKLSTAMTEYRTTRQSQALSDMGLSPEDVLDTHGNLIRIDKIIATIHKKTAHLSRFGKVGALSGLFGERGSRFALSAAQAGSLGEGRTLTQNIDALYNDSVGAAARIAKDRQNNMYGDIEKLKSSWEAMMISMGLALSPMVRIVVPALELFVDLITTIVNTPLGPWLVSAAAAFTVVKLAAGAYRFMLGSIALLTATAIPAATAAQTAAAAAGWGLATKSAAAYVAVLRVMGATGLLSSLGMGLNSAGEAYMLATGRVAGRVGIMGAIKSANLLTIALSGPLGPLKALAIGLMGLLGPIGGLIATVGVVGLAAYGIYRIFKGMQEASEISDNPHQAFLKETAVVDDYVQKIRASGIKTEDEIRKFSERRRNEAMVNHYGALPKDTTYTLIEGGKPVTVPAYHVPVLVNNQFMMYGNEEMYNEAVNWGK